MRHYCRTKIGASAQPRGVDMHRISIRRFGAGAVCVVVCFDPPKIGWNVRHVG